jgi:hypothetical protein
MLFRIIRWLFDLPGYCSVHNTKNKVVHGPNEVIEYCPECQKESL